MDANALATAAAVYRTTFGHDVPAEVLRLFEPRPAPLVLEIRQAIALKRPVPGWRARSRTPDNVPSIAWAPEA